MHNEKTEREMGKGKTEKVVEPGGLCCTTYPNVGNRTKRLPGKIPR